MDVSPKKGSNGGLVLLQHSWAATRFPTWPLAPTTNEDFILSFEYGGDE